ncbi:HAD family hydrolase [Streptomyces sp. NPDC087440]|uniref:HAD family hydrolase n=1 Tax=Streptomyces sp. NPDC087440 TaxID=3365790 RepID=UPI0037F43421
MTSESTDLGQAASVIEQWRDLVTGATCVLFDFDGPICGLFAGHRAHDIADRMIGWLGERGHEVRLTGRERDDPQAVLRAVAVAHPEQLIVRDLEQSLTEAELTAVPTAAPTPHADALIREWAVRGVPLAIATNNSSRAASRYLARRGLSDCFARHVYGRTENLDHLKPHPYSLVRALAALQADPAKSLMIGDTPTDLQAARTAGVPFLGYGRDPARIARLRTAGAEAVVASMEDVLRLLTEDGAQA